MCSFVLSRFWLKLSVGPYTLFGDPIDIGELSFTMLATHIPITSVLASITLGERSISMLFIIFVFTNVLTACKSLKWSYHLEK